MPAIKAIIIAKRAILLIGRGGGAADAVSGGGEETGADGPTAGCEVLEFSIFKVYKA
jgi:hypothetical protein